MESMACDLRVPQRLRRVYKEAELRSVVRIRCADLSSRKHAFQGRRVLAQMQITEGFLPHPTSRFNIRLSFGVAFNAARISPRLSSSMIIGER